MLWRRHHDPQQTFPILTAALEEAKHPSENQFGLINYTLKLLNEIGPAGREFIPTLEQLKTELPPHFSKGVTETMKTLYDQTKWR